jgi:hypothetical protein
LKKANKSYQHGKDLIKATGGALAPIKSYWYLVEVFWKDGAWRYKTKEEAPGSMHVKTEDGSLLETKRYEVTKAQEALGIYVRPDGSMEDEVKELRKKVDKWCDRIRTKQIFET